MTLKQTKFGDCSRQRRNWLSVVLRHPMDFRLNTLCHNNVVFATRHDGFNLATLLKEFLKLNNIADGILADFSRIELEKPWNTLNFVTG